MNYKKNVKITKRSSIKTNKKCNVIRTKKKLCKEQNYFHIE